MPAGEGYPRPVTVVLLPRPRGGLLTRSLSDALAQRGVDVEVLAPPAYAAAGETRVRSLELPGPHPADVLDAALAIGRGPWFAFLEVGDRWHADHLGDAVRRAENASARWVHGAAALLAADGRTIGRRPAAPAAHLAAALRRRNVIGGASSVVCDRELLAERPPFDRSLSSHVLWAAWIALARAPSVSSPEELVAERYEDERAVLDPRGSLAEMRRLRRAGIIDRTDRSALADLAARMRDLGHAHTAARAYALSAIAHRHPSDAVRAARALRSRGGTADPIPAPAWLDGPS